MSGSACDDAPTRVAANSPAHRFLRCARSQHLRRLLASCTALTLIGSSPALAQAITANGVDLGVLTGVNISVPNNNRAVAAYNPGGAVTLVGGQILAQSSIASRSIGLLARTGGVIVSSANVTTTGDRGHAVQAGNEGTNAVLYAGASAGTVTLTGGLIKTDGGYSLGLHTVDSGVINASNVVIQTSGAGSFGGQAESMTTINLTNVDVITTGLGAVGIVANNDRLKNGIDITTPGSVINATDTRITTSGATAGGALASHLSRIALTGGAIETSGAQAAGLAAAFHGAITSSANVTTTGNTAHGAVAGVADAADASATYNGSSAGTIAITGGAIMVSGAGAKGLFATDSGVINASGASITTAGLSAAGVHADSNSAAYLDSIAVHTSGEASQGLLASNARRPRDPTTTGGAITSVTGSVRTEGAWAHGVEARDGAHATLTGGSITTSGQRGYGLLAHTGGIIDSSASITTSGDRAHAVQAGANGTTAASYQGDSAGTVTQTGGAITTSGFYALGLHAVDGGHVLARHVAITTSGAAAFGAQVESNSLITLENTSISTTGDGAHGFVANNDRRSVGLDASASGGTLRGQANIVTTGAGAHGGVVEHGGRLEMADSSLSALGNGSAGLLVGDHGVAILDNTSIFSATDAAIRTHNSASLVLFGSETRVSGGTAAIASSFSTHGQLVDILIGPGAQVRSANNVLMSVDRSGVGGDTGVVLLGLANGAEAFGDILDLGQKSSGYTDVELGETAIWRGVAKGVRNVRSLNGGGRIHFGDGSIVHGDITVGNTELTFGAGGVHVHGGVWVSNHSRAGGGSKDFPIMINGDVFVDSTSHQYGNWWIGGNLTSQGIIAPGNSIGLIHVGGNLSLAKTSQYHVEIDGNGRTDRIEVDGKAALAGSVRVLPEASGFRIGAPYAILTAKGGLGGSTYDGGISWADGRKYLFLAPLLSYDASNAYLTIGRSDVRFASVAASQSQRATAAALDQLPVNAPLVALVAMTNTPQGAAQAFDAMSGEVHASLAGALVENSHVARDAVNNRLLQAYGDYTGANSASVQTISGLNAAIWGQGSGSWGHTGATHAATARLESSSTGFMAGIDAGVTDNWRLGLAGGYGRSNVDMATRNSTARADSYNLALYGGGAFGAFRLRMGAAYTWNDANVRRGVAFTGFSESANVGYRSGIAQGFGEVSYAAVSGATTIDPFLNTAWVGFSGDQFREQGGYAALDGKAASMNTAFTTLGARVAHTIALENGSALTARGLIGWRHAFGDIIPRSRMSFAGEHTAFIIAGAPIAQNSLVVEAGLNLNIAANVSLSAVWTGQFAEKGQDQSLKGSFAIKF